MSGNDLLFVVSICFLLGLAFVKSKFIRLLAMVTILALTVPVVETKQFGLDTFIAIPFVILGVFFIWYVTDRAAFRRKNPGPDIKNERS